LHGADWDGAFHSGKTINTRQIISEAEAGGFFVFATLVEADWDPDLRSGGFVQTMILPLVTVETRLTPLNFSGDGGSYSVTFTVRIKGG